MVPSGATLARRGAEPDRPGAAPAPTMGSVRVLLATDGSPGAERALRFLLSLPLSVADHVTILTVPRYTFVSTPDGDAAEALPAERDLREAAAIVAQNASALFAARSIPTGRLVADGPVAEAIERAAIERSAEFVVIGSRGLGAIAGVLLGSTGRALARCAPVSVLVVREQREAPRRILAAVDGSAESDIAMDLICRLPLAADIEITLLHVLSESEPVQAHNDGFADELRAIRERHKSQSADEALFRATRGLHGRRVARSIVERGDPIERIVVRALAGSADLVVLGSHGQREAHGLTRASVADEVCAVRTARCSSPSHRSRRVPLLPKRTPGRMSSLRSRNHRKKGK
jgi:nucleotide-binding universal stress UspA family protein